jgi:hypothetical protein
MDERAWGVDAYEKKGVFRVRQQQCCRQLLSPSLSLAADAAACRLHVGMVNSQ